MLLTVRLRHGALLSSKSGLCCTFRSVCCGLKLIHSVRSYRWYSPTPNVSTATLWCLLSCSSEDLGAVSIPARVYYRHISYSLEAATFVFRIVRYPVYLTCTSIALLSKGLSNFKAIWKFKLPISQLRDLTRPYDKTPRQVFLHGTQLVQE